MSDPGNTLATAQLIAINAGSQTYSDAVSTADPDDYYRFTLSGRSSINLTLTGLSGNADLQVLNGAGTVLQQSTNPGTAAEDVNLTDLSAGVYYVRVFAASGTTNAPYTFTRQAINNAQTDILWRNYSTGQNTAWAMNGTTRVSSTDLKPISDVNWRLEGSADFSGDGQADLVWRNYSTGQNVIWLMNGTTSLSEVNLQAVGTNWHISGTGDFNSDGKTDLVWRNYSTGEDVVWLLNGTTFSTTVNLQAVGDPSWQINGTGDFNNDGQTDLLWRRYDGTGETVVWFMNGTTFSTAVNLQAVGDPNWRISGTGDFNHDGQTDILWRRYSTGEDVIWLMNGTTLLSNGGVYFNPIGDLNWQIAASFVHYGDPGSLDTAGNTPATAFDVGTLTGQATYTGTVNGSDVNDYYRFTLSTAAPNFTLALKGLSGDANLQLLDGSSNTLQTASNSGTTAELMQRALTAGTYYLRVFPATSSVSANYTLSTVFDAAPPTVTVALVNDTALNGTNTDRRTADPTISVQLSTERPLGHLRAGFNNTLVANYTDIAVPLQAGSVTLTPAQLQAINGGLPLTDGSYVLHLRATGVEDVLVTTTDFTLTLDRTTAAPSNLQLTAGSDSGQSASDNVTNVTTPTVTGTAEAGALIQLYSQGQVIGQGTAAGNGVWQITVQPLVAGTTTLTAIATDVAGNVSAASTVLSLVVDTQAPSAPSFLPLDSTADTGESHSDGITRNPTPTLTGHAEAGTNITLWNNAQVVGQTRTDASGFWQLTTLSLPQGLATLRATATDQAGNVSAASTPLLLTVDTVAPAAPGNVRFAAGIDKGRSSTDGQTNVNTPIVTGTAAPHTLVQLWGEGQLLGQQTSDANGNWQIQTPTLADGGYYLSAFALDLAGNRSLASPALALIIDTQAPTAPTLLPLSAISDTGSSASDGVTANPTPTVVGQSAAYALVQLLDQEQVIGQMIADETGAWQITAPTLTEGAHTFTTTATDVAGNVSVNSAPLSLTIDTALPTLTVTTPLTTPLGSSTRLAGTVAGTGSAIVSASYHFDDRPAIALAFDPATGTFDQALDLTGITSDTHTLTLTTTDTAGNIKTLQPTVTVALGSAPVITAALAQDTAPGGLTNDDGVTSNPTISGQVTNAPAVLRAGFGTGASVTYGDITAQLQLDGSFTLNRAQLETLYGGTLVDAHYTLSLQATDAAGNVTTPLAITFDLDTQAPTAPTNLSLTPAGMYAVAITGNAAAGAQVQLFEGTTLIGEALANAAGSWRVTTSQLRNGTHSLTATASDVAGNTSPATTETTFTVETLVPSVPQGLRLTALTDSGQSQTDNITNNATPTIVGTTEAGATVRLFRAQQLLGETVADITTGAWSIALTTALPEGEQSLSVVAHNAIGDSQTATLLTTIDTVAPTTTQLSVLATGSTTATALANGVTLTTGTRLLGQVHGTTSAVASLQYQLGTNPAVTVPVAANGLFNYRLAFTGSNSGDNQTLSVTLTDVAGNTTTLAPFLVNVSATNDGGGEAPVLVAQLLQDTGSDASDGWTYIPGIAGVASAPGVITALLATFDTATDAVFQDLSDWLQPDGTFVLDEETLADLAGGDLEDGEYTLRLRVQANTNQMAEQVVSLKLDRTAPVTTLPNLIDGIAWERGTHLQGTVVEASAGVEVAYQLETVNGVSVGSSHTLAVADQAFDQVLDAATLAEETPYNLVLTSTDRAGNAQRSRFQFFIPSDRKVTDNDTLPNQPSDADPMPSGAATSEDIGSWGSVGSGGGWGGWSGPLGGGGSGGSGGGMFTPTMVAGNPVGLAAEPQPASVPAPLAGSGYEYAESIERIVGAAVNFISVSPETLTKKAALYNRESLLRALGRQVQRLIYSDGNFANDQSLVERLRPVLAGLFADAYDPRAKGVDTEGRQIDRAGVEHAFAPLGAAWLAQSLLSEPLAGLSVREQVFQATLLAVVTEATPGVTNVAQQQALAAAVMALAKTYAWLNPNPEATVPVADKDFGFLDALWRLQIPDANGQFKGSGDIAQTLEDSVMALERLLEGVEDKVRAIQFLNNLVQAASNVTSLKADVKDATFLRELVEFGVEFVKTNPTVNATATDTAVQGFLDRLWRGDTQQVKQAQGGLNAFFAGMETEAERIKGLEFAGKLIDAASLLQDPGLQAQKHDPAFLDALVELGGAYAALEPTQDGQQSFFLDNIWKMPSGDSTSSFEEFLQPLDNTSINKALEFSSKLLKALKAVPAAQPFIHDPAFLKQYVYLARDYVRLNPDVSDANEANSSLDLLYAAKTPQDIAVAAQKLQEETVQFLENNSLGGPEDVALSGRPFVATDDESQDLKRILTSGISRYNIPDYSVYNVVRADQNPSEEVVIVNANDGPEYGKLVYNRIYPIGQELGYTLSSGDTYSHAYLLRDGELYYYIEGTPLTLQPGDKLLYEKPFLAQADKGAQLSTADQAQIKSGIEDLAQFYEPLGKFVAGAVYQWAYDLGESGRVILNLMPDWRKLDLSVEADLPKDPAFVAGRLLGNGGAAIAGLLGFVAGGTAAVGGSALCLAPGVCLASGPAAVAGAALAITSAITLKEALENAFQNASVLLSSGLNGFFSKDSLDAGSGNSSRPTQESVKQLSGSAKIKQDEAFAIRELINRRSIKKNGLMLIKEKNIGKFFGYEEKSLPSLPEALIEKQNGSLIAVEVKNKVSPNIDGKNGVLPKFREISRLVKESNLGKRISEFHLYINKDKFEGQLRGTFSIGKGNFLFEDGKILQIDGVPVQIRFTDFKGR